MSDSDETLAELLAVVLSGRADPLVDVGLSEAPPALRVELRRELGFVREALASLALAEAPCEPSPALRSRILQKLAQPLVEPRRALLVIDMQNDHLMPGRPLEVPRARAIVPAVAARVADARKAEIPVIYVVDEHDPDDSDLEAWGAHNVKGTSGADVWPALAPLPGDSIVSKPTYSAFTRSRLGEVLAKLQVDTLVLTGCLTEIGMLATATDALEQGYAVEVPPDAQAGATAQNEELALGILGLLSPYGPARQALVGGLRPVTRISETGQ